MIIQCIPELRNHSVSISAPSMKQDGNRHGRGNTARHFACKWVSVPTWLGVGSLGDRNHSRIREGTDWGDVSCGNLKVVYSKLCSGGTGGFKVGQCPFQNYAWGSFDCREGGEIHGPFIIPGGVIGNGKIGRRNGNISISDIILKGGERIDQVSRASGLIISEFEP